MNTHLILMLLGAALLLLVAGVVGRKLQPPRLDDVLRRAKGEPDE